MVTTIKKGTPIKVMRKLLEDAIRSGRSGFEAKRFLGILGVKEINPLDYQKRLRDEWE